MTFFDKSNYTNTHIYLPGRGQLLRVEWWNKIAKQKLYDHSADLRKDPVIRSKT